MDNLDITKSNFLLYRSQTGEVKVAVLLQNETVWLTQKTMGYLFGVESHTINYHLKEIYKSGELDAESTTRKIRAVQKEGNREVKRNLDFYNLDVIISVEQDCFGVSGFGRKQCHSNEGNENERLECVFR